MPREKRKILMRIGRFWGDNSRKYSGEQTHLDGAGIKPREGDSWGKRQQQMGEMGRHRHSTHLMFGVLFCQLALCSERSKPFLPSPPSCMTSPPTALGLCNGLVHYGLTGCYELTQRPRATATCLREHLCWLQQAHWQLTCKHTLFRSWDLPVLEKVSHSRRWWLEPHHQVDTINLPKAHGNYWALSSEETKNPAGSRGREVPGGWELREQLWSTDELWQARGRVKKSSHACWEGHVADCHL